VRIWEAHKALSLALGDTVNFLDANGLDATIISPPNSMPDGVWLLHSLRNSQIYRAMLKVYNEIIMSVAPLDRQIAGSVIEKIMPNTILTETQTIALNNSAQTMALDSKIIYLTKVYCRNENNDVYPIPIKNGIEVNALLNTRNVQNPDAFAYLFNVELGYDVSILHIYDFKNEIDGMTAYISFIKYPRNPAIAIDNSNPDYNWNSELDIEEILIPKVLSYAKLYALQEHQDMELLPALQMELISPNQQGG